MELLMEAQVMDDTVVTLHRDCEHIEGMLRASYKLLDITKRAADVEISQRDAEIAQLKYENVKLKKELMG
jgi:uncharacterized protein YdcH (DUF465 family)